MDEWLMVQRNWMYLEPIFAAPDIQRQMPLEYKTFEGVDKDFKFIMKRAAENPTCMRVGLIGGKKESLALLNQALDKIQKALEDYLEFKRMAFPRFYFLSNDELLEILSQTRNVHAVQTYMNSCFDGIKSLDFGGQHPDSPVQSFDPKSVDIYGMISPEGEYVSLGKNLKARGEVQVRMMHCTHAYEPCRTHKYVVSHTHARVMPHASNTVSDTVLQDWLAGIEKRMIESLRLHAKEAIADYHSRSRTEWVLLHPSQLIIMVSQLRWCSKVEDAMQRANAHAKATGLDECLKLQLGHLRDQCTLAASHISALRRMCLVALITIDVHNRDILEDLVREKVLSMDNFLANAAEILLEC